MTTQQENEYIQKSTELLYNNLKVLEDIIHKLQGIKEPDPNIAQANVVVITLLDEFFVILEGTCTLVKKGQFRPVIILVRSLLEIALQVLYLCDDKNTFVKKAQCYTLFTISKTRQYLETKKDDIGLTPKEDGDYQCYLKLEKCSPDPYVQQKQNDLRKILDRRKYLDSWYGLYDKNLSSVRSLAKATNKKDTNKKDVNQKDTNQENTNQEKLMKWVYGKLSQVAHGGDAVSNLIARGQQLSLRQVDSVKSGYWPLNVINILFDVIIPRLDSFYSQPGEHTILQLIPKDFSVIQKKLYKEIKDIDKNIVNN